VRLFQNSNPRAGLVAVDHRATSLQLGPSLPRQQHRLRVLLDQMTVALPEMIARRLLQELIK
jgi:hypothetical protein